MIILYSTGCPKCKVLIKKLNDKKIPYIECNDIEIIKSKGMQYVPFLGIDDKEFLDFKEALEWIEDK